MIEENEPRMVQAGFLDLWTVYKVMFAYNAQMSDRSMQFTIYCIRNVNDKARFSFLTRLALECGPSNNSRLSQR